MAPLPPLELDDSVGGVSSNTYISLDDAEIYMASRLWTGNDWSNATDDNKNRALAMATRLLDQWFDWSGYVVSKDQALLWPRAGVSGPNGYLVASNSIPERIRQACAEWARQLLISDRTADNDAQGASISKVVAGPVEVDFSGTATAKPIPDMVVSLVAPYGTLRNASGSGIVELLRA